VKDGEAKKKLTSRKKKTEPAPEITEKAPAKKRQKKPLTDSDEDWEDFGFNPSLPKYKVNPSESRKRVQQESEVEDDMGLDSDFGKIASDTAGFDMSDDTETRGEQGTSAYPSTRDRYTKKSKSAGAALKRAGEGVPESASRKDARRVIELDSFD